MTEIELEKLFIQNKIEKYIDKFKQEKIFSKELILQLDEKDFLEIGITSQEEQNIIKNLFTHQNKKIESKICVKKNNTIMNPSDEEILNMFFKKYGILEFAEEFKKQKVFSTELLKDLSDSDLQQLGVTLLGDRKKLLKLFQGNELSNFKNDLLYKNLSIDEKSKLKIEENKILKQNSFKFKYNGGDPELGILTLYSNRIIWKGNLNNFVIAISDIIDISVFSTAAKSTLIIKTKNDCFNFTIQNNHVALSAAAASLSGMSDTAVIGMAMLNDKPITDIEVWRQKIDFLREENKKNPNTFGIPENTPQIIVSNDFRNFSYFIVGSLFIIIIVFFVWLFNQ